MEIVAANQLLVGRPAAVRDCDDRTRANDLANVPIAALLAANVEICN
jgi:hypothetical protein